MDYQAIADGITETLVLDAQDNNTSPEALWDDAKDDYLKDGMPYDVRQLEKRDYPAEAIVAQLVNRLLGI